MEIAYYVNSIGVPFSFARNLTKGCVLHLTYDCTGFIRDDGN